MINDSDKALHKALMKILDEGTFSLKVREVPAFIKVYNWVSGMADEQPKPQPKPKKKAKKK